ncbi:MAG: hypothetical protein V4603_00345 [Pseudomonadota bacterium]
MTTNARNDTFTRLKSLGLLFTAVACLLLFSFVAIHFVWHDGLASFASDSGNYMLMARYLSPWHDASEPVRLLWPLQDYPPFFPLILALCGTAYSMVASHLLTLFFLIAALPLIYLFAKQLVTNRWQALAITVLFAISPSTWVNMLDILSENLYLLLSMLVLLLFPHLQRQRYGVAVLLGVLLTCLIMTRTIGAAMWAAYLIAACPFWKKAALDIKTWLIPSAMVLASMLLLQLLNTSSVPDQYVQQFSALELGGQFSTLADSWLTAWLLYWTDDLILSWLIAGALGLVACGGLFVRAAQLKLDALYILLYLVILLAWPHPGQALRFIYPVQAVLLVHAFYFLQLVITKYTKFQPQKALAFVLLLTATAVLPALTFLYSRHNAGIAHGYHHIKEFYTIPDLPKAEINAAVQTAMFRDMNFIEASTTAEDVVYYFEPTYVALLANRHGRNLNGLTDSVPHIAAPAAEYVYLSRMHPRNSTESFNGLEVGQSLGIPLSLQWSNVSSVDQAPVSNFSKID